MLKLLVHRDKCSLLPCSMKNEKQTYQRCPLCLTLRVGIPQNFRQISKGVRIHDLAQVPLILYGLWHCRASNLARPPTTLGVFGIFEIVQVQVGRVLEQIILESRRATPRGIMEPPRGPLSRERSTVGQSTVGHREPSAVPCEVSAATNIGIGIGGDQLAEVRSAYGFL